jgi:hypothetical protein
MSTTQVVTQIETEEETIRSPTSRPLSPRPAEASSFEDTYEERLHHMEQAQRELDEARKELEAEWNKRHPRSPRGRQSSRRDSPPHPPSHSPPRSPPPMSPRPPRPSPPPPSPPPPPDRHGYNRIPVPARPTIKVAKPDEFHGDPKDVDKFLYQCNLYLQLEPYTDRQKIAFAMSYMKSGSALRWAEMMMKAMQTQPLYTWRNFQTNLSKAFSDTDRHATARLEIDNVKQGSNSVDEYNIRFTEVAMLTEYDELALIEKYKRGLKEAILSKMYSLPTMPTRLNEWKQRASLFDRQYREFQQYHHSKPASSSSSSSKQKSKRPAGSSSTATVSKPATTTLSPTPTATRSTPAPRTSATPAPAPCPVKQETVDPVLAEQRKQAGLCILCGEAGHWANVCPTRVRKQFKGKGRDRGSGKSIRTMDKDSQDTSKSTTSKQTSSSTSTDISSITDKLSKNEKQALVMQLIKDAF